MNSLKGNGGEAAKVKLRDVLSVQPTGSGKTSIWQFAQAIEWLERPEPFANRAPPLLFQIVSPTISLSRQVLADYMGAKFRGKLAGSDNDDVRAFAALLHAVDLSPRETRESDWQCAKKLTLRTCVFVVCVCRRVRDL